MTSEPVRKEMTKKLSFTAQRKFVLLVAMYLACQSLGTMNNQIEAVMPFILWEQVWGMLLANGLHACVMLAVYGRAGTTKPNVKMSIFRILP